MLRCRKRSKAVMADGQICTLRLRVWRQYKCLRAFMLYVAAVCTLFKQVSLMNSCQGYAYSRTLTFTVHHGCTRATRIHGESEFCST
jgi:hypothetical protein